MLSRLIPSDDSEAIAYKDSANNPIKVTIMKLGSKYFAKLSCHSLTEVLDKKLFIKNAVEFALAQKKLSVSFDDIAVGGVVSDNGRMTSIAKFVGVVPMYHAFTVFKTPGEEEVSIEDPRTGILERNEKLQSRFDDQVCGFAATALFYFCYKAFAGSNKKTLSSNELFDEVYDNPRVRALIQSLENKVGRAKTTKEEVIKAFPNQLINLEIPAAGYGNEPGSSATPSLG